MGAPNAALNVYMSKKERIRDVFEFYIKENLPEDFDIKMADGFYSLKDGNILTSRERDRIKRVVNKKGDEFYLAIENQKTVNFTFPQRVMEMDGLEYKRQVEAIRQRNIDNKVSYTSDDDFKYRFKADDRLAPVFTLKLYWGKRKRNMPESLKDIMNLEWLPNPIKEMFNDYRVHMVCMLEIPDEELFKMKSDLKYVIGIIKRKGQGNGWQKFVEENADYFENMPLDAYDVICVCAGIKNLKKYIKVDENKGEETVDMCKAIRDIQKEARAEGRREGRAERKQEVENMCKAIKDIKKEARAEGRREGIREGRSKGKIEGKIEGVKGILETLFAEGIISDEIVKKYSKV